MHSGASASASTWETHATIATSQPIANQRYRNRPAADSQRLPDVHGRSVVAPRCLKKTRGRSETRNQREEDVEFRGEVHVFEALS